MALTFRLAAILAERNMTQSELARRSGITYPTINRIYQGNAEAVALGTLESLCRTLRVTPGELFYYRPSKRT